MTHELTPEQMVTFTYGVLFLFDHEECPTRAYSFPLQLLSIALWLPSLCLLREADTQAVRG
jgi:hypothetical protein